MSASNIQLANYPRSESEILPTSDSIQNDAKLRSLSLKPQDLAQAGQENCDNRVRTSKYTALSFLPLNLFVQLSKGANMYFILITFMQLVDVISISNGKAAMLPPLVFVISLSMIKDAYEDYQRHKSDDKENDDTAHVYDPQTRAFKDCDWHNIRVGQIVKVTENKFFPADLLLIHSSGIEGISYVETKNLDGETNLKHKSAPKELTSVFDAPSKFNTFSSGHLNCEAPNNQIYKFDGNMILPDVCQNKGGDDEPLANRGRIPLSNDNIVLRGMSLRNTEVVYGLAVYTGPETKIQQNTQKAQYKHSKMMRATSRQVFIIFTVQIILASIGSVVGSTWMINNLDIPYLEFGDAGDDQWNTNWWLLFIKTTGTWVLIFTNFVPISLLVTLELVKFWQASFIETEVMMYDQNQDLPASAQSSNLNEELGQVEYIFSDKTGTLTCNIMEFKKFSAGMHAYSVDNLVVGELNLPSQVDLNHRNSNIQAPPSPKNNGQPALLTVATQERAAVEDAQVKADNLLVRDGNSIESIIADPDHPEYPAVSAALMHMALCHTVIIDPKKGNYSASSPDELALVEGAKSLGFEFLSLDQNGIMAIRVPHDNEELRFELLNILEFNSTRKRMSVIIRDLQTNQLQLLTKGADSIIEKLMAGYGENSQDEMMENTMHHIEEFAVIGLRTLLLTKRDLTEEVYAEWNAEWTEASQSVINRDEKLEVINAKIEHELELVGSTAIEDKLQDDVAETIVALKKVGIKVWVLTGDKVETAINIGYSAGLLDDTMEQFIIQDKSESDILLKLDEVKVEISKLTGTGTKIALVVAGESLIEIQSSATMKAKLLNITDLCDVVLGCRVSPKQKADIVEMIRVRFPNKTTLSIGDGANDVSMIMKAHVGVGIAGREGMQAARSSDFAIGQFKFLKPLLFIHGRECYRRNAELVCYTFYKNVVYVIPQYFFGFWSVFSGQTLYEPWIYQLYNITFTGLPIMLYALFDFQYTKEHLVNNSQLYKMGMKDEKFGSLVFWKWIFYGFYQGWLLLIFSIILTEQPSTSMDNTGRIFSFWASGQTLYGACVVLVNLVLLKMHNLHNGYSELFLFLQATAYFWILYLETLMPGFTVVYRFWEEYVSSYPAWCGFLLLVTWPHTVEKMVRVTFDYVMTKGDGSKQHHAPDHEVEGGSQEPQAVARQVEMATTATRTVEKESLIRRNTLSRRSTLKHSGYAFSEDAGGSLFLKRQGTSWGDKDKSKASLLDLNSVKRTSNKSDGDQSETSMLSYRDETTKQE